MKRIVLLILAVLNHTITYCAASSSTKAFADINILEKKRIEEFIKKVLAFTIISSKTTDLMATLAFISAKANEFLIESIKNVGGSLDPKTQMDRIKQAITFGANVNNPNNPNEYEGSPLEINQNYNSPIKIEHAKKMINQNYYEIVKLLIESGANVNAQTKIKKPKHINVISLLKDLIDDLSLDVPRESDNWNDYIKLIEFILENPKTNANLHTEEYKNGNYETLLIHAAASNLPDVVSLLLFYGANPHIGQDAEGDNFKTIAEGNKDILDVYNNHLIREKIRNKKKIIDLAIYE